MNKTVTIRNSQRGFATLYEIWIDGELSQVYSSINSLLSFLNLFGATEIWETDYAATKAVEA